MGSSPCVWHPIPAVGGVPVELSGVEEWLG